MHLSGGLGKPGGVAADRQTLGTMRGCSAWCSGRSHFSSRAISSDVTWTRSAFRRLWCAAWSYSCSPWQRLTVSHSSSTGPPAWRDSSSCSRYWRRHEDHCDRELCPRRSHAETHGAELCAAKARRRGDLDRRGGEGPRVQP